MVNMSDIDYNMIKLKAIIWKSCVNFVLKKKGQWFKKDNICVTINVFVLTSYIIRNQPVGNINVSKQLNIYHVKF